MSIKNLLFLGLIIVCSSFATEDKKAPNISDIKFGEITIDGTVYDHDIVIDNYKVRKRKKGPSKSKKGKYGHTPLTHREEIPWDCKVLVIGIGMSERLPVTKKFKEVAEQKGVELILKSTPEAIKYYNENADENMNAIFHITC